MHVRTVVPVSERRACRVLAQPRSTQRRPAHHAGAAVRALYGSRRIMALLRAEGWRVNHKRVERLWRREGLRVPAKPPRRRRLWLADGTITRRRATRPNHVWSYDFVPDRTHDGRSRRLLCVVDEYTRACLAIVVAPRLRADDVLACRTQLFVAHGPPTSLRSDNGPEFTAHAVRSWLLRVGVTTLFIQPVSPWENGSGESFNSKLRDECLNGEIFTTLAEAKVLIARWRREYNEQRPHSALGYRPPPPTIEARPAVGLQELPPMTALTSNVVQRWGAGHTFRRRKAAFSLSPWLVAREMDGAPRFRQGRCARRLPRRPGRPETAPGHAGRGGEGRRPGCLPPGHPGRTTRWRRSRRA